MKTKEHFINVTQLHINNGQPCNGRYCPIANALASGLKLSPYNISVSDNDMEIKRNEKRDKLTMPHNMREFVKQFDAYWEVEPFTFIVEEDEETGRFVNVYLPEKDSHVTR